jgi:hypothetical protein
VYSIIRDIAHIHKEENEYLRLQHTRTLRHNQKTKRQDQRLRIHRVEGAEIQTKGTGNLFNKTTAKSFPSLCSDTDTHVQEAF